jgi:periplasmic glucans biosynthesis protein
VYALLDSPSLVGAYQYVIIPGKETVMKVDSVLFPRKRIEKLGIAPMTSMFYYGENAPRSNPGEDFRPEVHDSDGMLVSFRSGEWLWRPLMDPPKLLVNAFQGGTPVGFGLLQRDTNFDHYQDLESRFERRPSLWAVPSKDWGDGHLELVQIPSSSEYNDNINVYWVPQTPIEAGSELNYGYTLHWFDAKLKASQMAEAVATRIAHKDKDIKFVIDFEGEQLNALKDEKDLTANVSASKGGVIVEQQVIRNPLTGGFRLVFKLNLEKESILKEVLDIRPDIDLRAMLIFKGKPLTETWTYAFLP